MKKLILIIALCFAFALSASARMSTISAPSGTAAPVCNAPEWYDDSGVVFAWEATDGETAYNSSCATISGTLTNGDIGTYNSKTALRIDAAAEYVKFTQTEHQYVDTTKNQTVCIQYFGEDHVDTAISTFLATDTDNDDQVVLVRRASGAGYAASIHWYSQTGTDQTMGDPTCINDAWATMAMSWDVATTKHAANPGDNATWANGWYEETETLTAHTHGPVEIFVGNNSTESSYGFDGAPGSGKEQYISKVAVVDGYKFDCSTLTGW